MQIIVFVLSTLWDSYEYQIKWNMRILWIEWKIKNNHNVTQIQDIIFKYV